MARVDPVLIVFVAVYAGMILGGIPFLRIDRAGVALLGAVALTATGAVTLEQAWKGIDAPTLSLLFGLMLVSAQFRLSGFYSRLTRTIAKRDGSPERLLLSFMLACGALSALLTNDVVCLAVAPVLVDVCRRRALDPVPFLLGLAASSNVGSAATILGNPQNMLIGEALDVPFARYLLDGGVPAILGLVFAWWTIQRAWRGKFHRPPTGNGLEDTPYSLARTHKGALILGLFVIGLLVCPLPRGTQALLAGSFVLLSRKTGTRSALAFVDWPLLVLFAGLFVVNSALEHAGHPARWLEAGATAGLDVRDPVALFAVTALGSNVVSNVPLVMLLLPAAEHPQAAAILALSSTLAGNLLLIGSIANLIVVEQARMLGVEPLRGSWTATHLRTGIPITLGTLAIAAAWLWLRAAV
jgi:Na+/H+ antiporter NhaD/arsenite permease-like protein